MVFSRDDLLSSLDLCEQGFEAIGVLGSHDQIQLWNSAQ